MSDDWREDYGYWDGTTAGYMYVSGKHYFFQLKDGESLYPDISEQPHGRRYDMWCIEREPNDDDLAADPWWSPDKDPDGSLTEEMILAIPLRPYI